MRLKTGPRPLGQLPLGGIAVAPLFFLPLGAHLIESGGLTLSQCGFKRLFNLPCFSCGSTRATIHLFHGELAAAIALQPLTMLIYLLLVIWGAASIWALFAHRSVSLKLTSREDLAVKLAVILIPFLNWGYLVHAGI